MQTRNAMFLRDGNPDFGVWHNPNTVNRQVKSCFDVIYGSNSYDTRSGEQCLKYMKATGIRVCLLVNFYEPNTEQEP